MKNVNTAQAAVSPSATAATAEYSKERMQYCAEACEGLSDPKVVLSSLTLEVSKVIKYGREEFRPENPTAEGFARLLRQKVLTRENIESIKKLGHRVILKGGEL